MLSLYIWNIVLEIGKSIEQLGVIYKRTIVLLTYIQFTFDSQCSPSGCFRIGCVFAVEVLCWPMEQICAAWKHSGGRRTKWLNYLQTCNQTSGMPPPFSSSLFFPVDGPSFRHTQTASICRIVLITSFFFHYRLSGSAAADSEGIHLDSGLVGSTGTSFQQRETYPAAVAIKRLPGNMSRFSARGVRGGYI